MKNKYKKIAITALLHGCGTSNGFYKQLYYDSMAWNFFHQQ